ncbi:MAG: ATP-binding protein [Nocardioides sp.]|uniref:sensor histidine kinase n=1 Tax=Nocardioides sp. TaxID=35761 RepID=UPI003267CB22
MSRLSLSRQLMLLQMCIVVFVVTAVAGVSLVQSSASFTREEGRRMLGSAESMATEGLIRQSAGLTFDGETIEESEAQARLQEPVRIRLEGARVSAGATYAILLGADGQVLGSTLTTEDADLALRSEVADGASWSGISERYGRRTIEAQVPVFGDNQVAEDGELAGERLGIVVLGRNYPTRLEVLGSAAPGVFAYLALAMAIGAAGSLLLARRVKRQTLGLEPSEIAGLVEQREAMLHGVREGVLGVDMRGVVAFANDEALHLLGVRPPVLGRSVEELDQEAEVTAILCGRHRQQDLAVAVGARLLVLNNQPVTVRGRQTGWVTSMRDRTELLDVQNELAEAQAGTDTLRAQVHEFRNRMHAIAGMAELDQSVQLREFVRAVVDNLDARLAEVSGSIADPAVAALLVAKLSRAGELGVAFSLAEGARLGRHDPVLSADLVTVVGNLVDNAFDAVGRGGEVVMDVEDDGDRIEIEVRDSGGGIAPSDMERIFEPGFTTKVGEDVKGHGFGLALTRMACARHGGAVTVSHRDGAVLSAELFVDELTRG